MSNATLAFGFPPLPEYTLKPLPPLIPSIPDKLLILILPVAAYWIVSLTWHFIDVNDYLSKYRLHTPAEVLKRNHATRWEVLRDVLLQQVVQTAFGIAMAAVEPDDVFGKEDYDIAVWARRLRGAQRLIPNLLSLFGVDALGSASKLGAAHPILAGALSGGNYPSLTQTIMMATGEEAVVPAFANWELTVAKAIYWVGIPALQFFFGALIIDTWQYWLHRIMHTNPWLYSHFHSRHHRLYVPYAYGALYNHPLEGFLLDTLGTGIAYKVVNMTTRQGMWFFTGSTIKTIDDHCGYALPWDPLQFLTSNNAGYHDIHHQSWGIKTNFSQPFFTFWDRLLGTQWTGGDVSARYERSRLAAQTKSDGIYKDEIKKATHLAQQNGVLPLVPEGKATKQAVGSREQVLQDRERGGAQVLAEETAEEKAAKAAVAAVGR
ncbi:hypothetical protein L228DRAFT_227865 [Xylona heveae TC161]|uniref:Fatty acid hydroxylase domain-containing protein n=1 Tax=Xylona heveae (strain CBS 132557 / TC161) TaxID=1328760 RepID=A0A161TPB0_XYLHT|nr:hypothetical protein L228DRAFT_227865 [Xylona heveae TC161]KZF23996.1 hypothetical protein L228DRAFT_227865 [Xylona heveae TC161]